MGMLALLLLIAQAPNVSAQGRNTTADKRTVLNDLATGRRDMPREELVALVSSGLNDPDMKVRSTALAVVAARATGARLWVTEERLKRWHVDRPALLELRPAIIRLVADSEPSVRRDAIVALGNLEFVPRAGSSGEVTLSDDVLRLFAARYDVEPSPVVRSELVKSLVLIANRSQTQEAVVLKALADPSAGVVQFAATGAGRMAISVALPTLADLLTSHADRAVRLDVAQAFAAFGSSAREYLPTLRMAAAAESDPLVRKTLEGTVRVVDK